MSATRQAGVELCEMKIALAECVCGVCAVCVWGGGGGVVGLQCVCPGDYYPHIHTAQG